MFRRILNILVAASLVFLLMLNGVAHEFVHSFAGHEDTIDRVVTGKQKGQVYFENEHHHCDFLHLPAPVFLTSSYYIAFPPFLLHKDKFRVVSVAICTLEQLHTSLRGPPAIA